MKNYNLLEDIALLKSKLHLDGNVDLIKHLEEEISSSSTGTELAMRVRYLLNQYKKKSDVDKNSETLKLITKIIESLNALLS